MCECSTPEPTKKITVALFGDVTTDWRESVNETLVGYGFNVVDDNDPEWKTAKTPEEILPLIEEWKRLLNVADIILWHANGGVIPILELCYLALLDKPAIVHVDQDARKRAHIWAIVLADQPEDGTLHWAGGTLHWAGGTLNEAALLAVTLASKLSEQPASGHCGECTDYSCGG
jgi:hypothetical protein